MFFYCMQIVIIRENLTLDPGFLVSYLKIDMDIPSSGTMPLCHTVMTIMQLVTC